MAESGFVHEASDMIRVGLVRSSGSWSSGGSFALNPAALSGVTVTVAGRVLNARRFVYPKRYPVYDSGTGNLQVFIELDGEVRFREGTPVCSVPADLVNDGAVGNRAATFDLDNRSLVVERDASGFMLLERFLAGQTGWQAVYVSRTNGSAAGAIASVDSIGDPFTYGSPAPFQTPGQAINALRGGASGVVSLNKTLILFEQGDNIREPDNAAILDLGQTGGNGIDSPLVVSVYGGSGLKGYHGGSTLEYSSATENGGTSNQRALRFRQAGRIVLAGLRLHGRASIADSVPNAHNGVYMFSDCSYDGVMLHGMKIDDWDDEGIIQNLQNPTPGIYGRGFCVDHVVISKTGQDGWYMGPSITGHYRENSARRLLVHDSGDSALEHSFYIKDPRDMRISETWVDKSVGSGLKADHPISLDVWKFLATRTANIANLEANTADDRGGRAWRPDAISGLWGWFRPDSYITSGGGNITRMDGIGAVALNDLEQSVTARRIPASYFDVGTDDHAMPRFAGLGVGTAGYYSDNSLDFSADWTLGILLRVTGTVDGSTILAIGGASDRRIIGVDSGQLTVFGTPVVSVSAGDMVVVVIEHTAGGAVSVRVQKGGVLSTASATNPYQVSSLLFVGNDAGYTSGGDFDLGGLAIVAASITASERDRLEAYLAWTYEQQAALVAAHPFKSSPPPPPASFSPYGAQCVDSCMRHVVAAEVGSGVKTNSALGVSVEDLSAHMEAPTGPMPIVQVRSDGGGGKDTAEYVGNADDFIMRRFRAFGNDFGRLLSIAGVNNSSPYLTKSIMRRGTTIEQGFIVAGDAVGSSSPIEVNRAGSAAYALGFSTTGFDPVDPTRKLIEGEVLRDIAVVHPNGATRVGEVDDAELAPAAFMAAMTSAGAVCTGINHIAGGQDDAMADPTRDLSRYAVEVAGLASAQALIDAVIDEWWLPGSSQTAALAFDDIAMWIRAGTDPVAGFLASGTFGTPPSVDDWPDYRVVSPADPADLSVGGLTDGGTSTLPGSLAIGASSQTQYTITNAGDLPLVIGTIAASGGISILAGDNPSGATVSAGQSTTFTVVRSTASSGSPVTGGVSIPSNDSSSPWTQTFEWTVDAPSASLRTQDIGVIPRPGNITRLTVTAPSAISGVFRLVVRRASSGALEYPGGAEVTLSSSRSGSVALPSSFAVLRGDVVLVETVSASPDVAGLYAAVEVV